MGAVESAGAVGGLGAILSLAGAQQQNSAATRASSEVRSASGLQRRQLQAQARQQRFEVTQREQQILGRLRVTAGTQGTSIESLSTLTQQAGFDAGFNRAVIDTNLDNTLALEASRTRAELAQLDATRQNPLLAMLTGGLEGVQAGLSLGLSLDAAQKARKEVS